MNFKRMLMEFKTVLEKLLTNFERLNIRYALLGGFALGLWGYARATADVDFWRIEMIWIKSMLS